MWRFRGYRASANPCSGSRSGALHLAPTGHSPGPLRPPAIGNPCANRVNHRWPPMFAPPRTLAGSGRLTLPCTFISVSDGDFPHCPVSCCRAPLSRLSRCILPAQNFANSRGPVSVLGLIAAAKSDGTLSPSPSLALSPRKFNAS